MKIYFYPMKYAIYSLWLHFNQAAMCQLSLIPSNANQISEWQMLLAQWTVLIIVSGCVIILIVLLHGYAWMDRDHCTSKDFMRRKGVYHFIMNKHAQMVYLYMWWDYFIKSNCFICPPWYQLACRSLVSAWFLEFEIIGKNHSSDF